MNRPQIDLTGAKILTVDDVPANLDVLSQALEAEGYNVLVATSGESALNVAAQTGPDLILLDVMMPGIDGFETCRRLKSNSVTRDIPVIFLTARNELEGVLEGFEAGGVDYVAKPFKKQEVLVRIRTHLERERLARDLAELNAHLEQKVEARTRALRQKLRELEGKDRIAQQLLAYHTLDNTFGLILEVIADVLDVERVVIYVREEDDFRPAAASGISEARTRAASDHLAGIERSAEHRQAFAQALQTRHPVQIEAPENSHAFTLVPILRGEDLLGLIEVANPFSGHPVEAGVIPTLASFALQTAIAITDAKIQEDASRWEEQLDKVLKLKDVVDNLDQLDNLTGGGRSS